MKKIVMLHGINHAMFGKRDPKQYGTITLAQIDEALVALGKEVGAEIESYQSDSEGDMCRRVHKAYEDKVDGVLINAGLAAAVAPLVHLLLRRHLGVPPGHAVIAALVSAAYPALHVLSQAALPEALLAVLVLTIALALAELAQSAASDTVPPLGVPAGRGLAERTMLNPVRVTSVPHRPDDHVTIKAPARPQHHGSRRADSAMKLLGLASRRVKVCMAGI